MKTKTKTKRLTIKCWLATLLSNAEIQLKRGQLDELSKNPNWLYLAQTISANNPKLVECVRAEYRQSYVKRSQ